MSEDDDLPRVLALAGASNVRDLGGWRTADGRRVRFGRVFRGAALDQLTDADGAALTAGGIGIVADLRGTAERVRAPSRLPPGIAVCSLPIEPSAGASLRDIAATRVATGEDVMDVLRRAYVAYALDWAHRYRALFDLLLREDAAPLLFHCSAGKDRTGFGAALLLTLLGVTMADVRTDYLATNRLWRGDSALAAELPAAAADALLRVHAPLLEAAFTAIAEEHGSFEHYAEARLGMDAARRQALRQRLLA